MFAGLFLLLIWETPLYVKYIVLSHHNVSVASLLSKSRGLFQGSLHETADKGLENISLEHSNIVSTGSVSLLFKSTQHGLIFLSPDLHEDGTPGKRAFFAVRALELDTYHSNPIPPLTRMSVWASQ